MHQSAVRAAGVASVAVMAVVLSACSSGASAGEDESASSRIVVGLAEAVDCLDPHQTPQTAPLHIGRHLVAGLTDQHPQTGAIVPWLAESWAVSDDATEFTFELRDDATYADGAPIDAASVVANLDDIVALGASSPLGAGYLNGYEGAEALDADTVIVRFASPSAQFLQATSTVTLGLLSPATLEQDAATRCSGALVGSGPFVLDEQVQNESVTLTARADYAWGGELAGDEGPPAVEALEFRIILDGSARHGSLLSGAIDVDTQVLPQDEASLGELLVSGTRPGVVYTLLPNESRPVLADPAVRRALSLAIDREALAPLLSEGERPATDVLSHTTPGYADRGDALAHDPVAAASALDAQGWIRADDGIRAKAGERLSLELVYSANERYGSVYEEIARQLAETGIELVLSPLDAAANSARQSAGDYDLVSWAVTRADPSILASIYPVDSANPLRRTAPDEVDAGIAEISATLDPAARQHAIDRAAALLIESAHGIPLFEQAASIAVAERISGVRLDASARPVLTEAEVAQ